MMNPHVQKAVIFGLVLLFLIAWTTFLLPQSRLPTIHRNKKQNTTIADPIDNATLGVSLCQISPKQRSEMKLKP